MSFESILIFVYGLLAFSISANSTPIPTTAERCVNSEAADPTTTSQTSELKLEVTIRKDLTPEGRTLRVDFDIEQETVTEEEEDFDAGHENVARDMDDYFAMIPEEGLSKPPPKDKDSKENRRIGKTAFLFADGFGGLSEQSADKKKKKRSVVSFNDGLDAPANHFTDGQEYKKERKHFLFDNNFGVNGDEISRVFGSGTEKKGQRTQFLFDTGIEPKTNMKRMTGGFGTWLFNEVKKNQFED